jgi:hypothetical protein
VLTEPVELIGIPVMPVSDAQAVLNNNPADARAHLTLFRAQVAAGQTDEAGATLEAGARFADNLAVYLLTASAQADAAGDHRLAIGILRSGLARIESDRSYPTFRAAAGEILYQAALSADNISLLDLGQLLAEPQSSSLGSTRNLPPDSTPIFSAMAARALLERDRLRAARLGLSAALQEVPNLPEGLLVSGELLFAQGDTAGAQAQWEAVLSAADAPAWVQAKARALLGR